MPEEKDYILYFWDGAVKRMRGLLSDLQKLPVKRIEEVIPGWTPSWFSTTPLSNVRRDVERINRAMGGVFKLIRPGSNGSGLPFRNGFFRGG